MTERFPAVGNFPIVSSDPETGEVVYTQPSRYRERFVSLDPITRQEIPDPRPVAAAVMFDDKESADARMINMINNAMAAAQLRMDRHDELEEEDYIFGPDEPEDMFLSPVEFIFDPHLGREVPRGLYGLVMPKKGPMQAPNEGDLPPTPMNAQEALNEPPLDES